MKTLIATLSLLLFTLLTSCGNKAAEPAVPVTGTPTVRDAVRPDTATAGKAPELRVVEFLAWYKANLKVLLKMQLVNQASGQTHGGTKAYSVNFEETEKYLKTLKASGFVSAEYIEHWQAYFKKADKHFKDNPQNEGPPENFDYDLVMQSQDVDPDLKIIQESKVASKRVQKDKAFVTLKLPSGQKLKFSLSSVNSKWLIDKIENANEG